MTELSPSERYRLSRVRVKHPDFEAFVESKPFDLDPFQKAACVAIDSNANVLVAAPTGAGKTIVAEFAIYRAMQTARGRAFYTTPIKALSNQKYAELVDQWGDENVGILTGDTSINSQARIVIMTTEVLRNMLYAEDNPLTNLQTVVMDEVHYLADRARGAAWEEIFIQLPKDIRIVSLSATVSNAEEFGDWINSVRGETQIIVSEDRPVPLHQHALIGGRLIELFDPSSTHISPRINPEILRVHQALASRVNAGARVRRGGGSSRAHTHVSTSSRSNFDQVDAVNLLADAHLLPAIFFVFSRKGCDQVVHRLSRANLGLTTLAEQQEIREVVEDHCQHLIDEDLGVLGYWEWLDGLEQGIAAHHAGLLPIFKEVIEELFHRRLLRVVVATETLALGVNMPARTVWLDKLEKFNGDSRVPLSPGEYTQLTGRAGRRGIDVEGHSVVQWNSQLNPQLVASLASKRTYPLNSSFKPSYNMATNLVSLFGSHRAREILESSFAQFQADRRARSLVDELASLRSSQQGYADSVECHLGDFFDYARIRSQLTEIERAGTPPKSSASAREQRAQTISSLRQKMKTHSCHHCQERENHARWAERWFRADREIRKLSEKISRETGAIATRFERICGVLQVRKYLSNDSGKLDITEAGRLLSRIYGERDLLVAESLAQGIWSELDAPSLAAIVSTLVYEPRREEMFMDNVKMPKGAFVDAFQRTRDLNDEISHSETEFKLPPSQPLQPGLAWAIHRWSQGARLDEVLRAADQPVGDFVRWTKQTIDLLDQISHVADRALASRSVNAIDSLKRGVVAYSGVL